MQDFTIDLISRIGLCLVFVVSGAQKLITPTRMAPLFQAMGLPSSTGIAVGLFELGAGVAFAFGFKLRWSAWSLAVWCLITAFIGHRFWQDPVQLPNFLKNIGIAGALMAIGFMAKAL